MSSITTFPDLLEIQRTSFCWFIGDGLLEELRNFTKVVENITGTEYLLQMEEFILIRPRYGILKAKKYDADYVIKLNIPLEVRNKQLNTIKYHKKLVFINLPLMTTFATFILNGCERVVISQIIRSPGIYFEKSKIKKNRKQFKRQLSANIDKLRNF